MKVPPKDQVTIPRKIQKRPGLTEDSEGGDLRKKVVHPLPISRFRRFRSAATVKMTTDEILSLTRGEE